MAKEEYTVLLAPTISHALKGESLLKKAGCSCKLIPVPRHLSSDCGVCLRIARAGKSVAQQILEQGGLGAGEWYNLK